MRRRCQLWVMAIDRHTMQPAYVLHCRPYANTSLLVECLTLSHGRFPAIAKGVKRGRSAAPGILQPFSPLLVRWSGRGEVKTLISYEAAAPSYALQGKVLYCGLYINELLVRLLHRDDPHERLFGLYGSTLAQLANGEPVEPILRHFEVELLEQLGFGLVLDRNAEDGSPLKPEQRYHYQIERGPVPCVVDDPAGYTGATLIGLRNGVLMDRRLLKEARALTRFVLGYYLGDRPLKSRELFLTSGEK